MKKIPGKIAILIAFLLLLGSGVAYFNYFPDTANALAEDVLRYIFRYIEGSFGLLVMLSSLLLAVFFLFRRKFKRAFCFLLLGLLFFLLRSIASTGNEMVPPYQIRKLFRRFSEYKLKPKFSLYPEIRPHEKQKRPKISQ